MNKDIYIYIDLLGKTQLVGYLWSRMRKGKESASFEYDKNWLESPNRFSLEPALSLGFGAYHTAADKALFGAIGDSAPDRWGRVLMRRAERYRAEKEKRTARTLMEADYLLMVNDEAREGALRFALEPGGPFLGGNNHQTIPPLIELSKLLSATERITSEEGSEEDLRLLLAPGSSLGGARPKASVRDRNGQLSIAKFPHSLDETNVVLWEALALTLAARAKISTPSWRIEKVLGKPVLLLHRFDRVNGNRIPYLSAMSMLDARDNEMRSYLEIVDALRQYGANAEQDIKELWRRIVFNILIANVDDHLRNHGFLYVGGEGWKLSPAFDLNPVPIAIKSRILSIAINSDDPTGSIALAMSVADYFDLNSNEAQAILLEVLKAISEWRKEAKKLGISVEEIERMSSAFLMESI